MLTENPLVHYYPICAKTKKTILVDIYYTKLSTNEKPFTTTYNTLENTSFMVILFTVWLVSPEYFSLRHSIHFEIVTY